MRTVGSKNRVTGARRRAILDTALAVFIKRGFEHASLEQICERLTITKGSVYHHFRSKEEIAVTLYAEAVSSIHAAVGAALAAARLPERGVPALVRAYLRWFQSHPDLGALVFQIMDGHALDQHVEQVRASQAAFVDATVTWLRPFIAGGTVRRLPPPLYVALVIGPSRDFLRGWFPSRDAAALRAALRVLPTAAWQCIAVSPAVAHR